MKGYEAEDIRTVALVGHGKAGKTSLSDAFLFSSKTTNRLGKVDDGSSNFDVEPEEIRRKGTIELKVGYCDWKKRKVNFIDTPGDANFFGDAKMGLTGASGAVLVVSAVDGVQVGTERVWSIVAERKLPAAIFINKLDRERANFEKVLSDVRETLTPKAVPIQLPVGKEQQFSGVIDLLKMKQLSFDASGATQAADISKDLVGAVQTAREALLEAIAATDDALIEKYLDSGELTPEEIQKGLATGIRQGTLVPVLCGSATGNLGVSPLLDLLAEEFPAACEVPPTMSGQNLQGQPMERAAKSDQPFSGIVFKTISSDVGLLAVVRVFSGFVTPDSTLYNSSRRAKERVGHIYAAQGKKRDNLDKAAAGDIVALPKLKETTTGDTLCTEENAIVYPAPVLPEPVISFAIRPKNKGDEDKVSTKLGEILKEDTSLRLERDPITQEVLLRGLGQIHLDMAVERLKRGGVEVELAEPRVPYRETIKGKAADVEGKHKKQSGGRGQYGLCYMDVEPKAKGEHTEDPLEFVNAIFGGAIPKQFVPSIEKGIRDRMGRGVISGFPVVDIKVTLKDGKYHPVDSDGRSFEMAGSKGFQEGFKRAHPILLEPVLKLEILCPEESMGDVIGDISSRRGKVIGTDSRGKNQVITAQAPQSEVLRYAIDLESITGGRGHFSAHFSHYEETPSNIAEKIIAAAKVTDDEDA